MKKISIGYIFDEPGLREEEKIFLDLAKKKNISLVMINIAKDLSQDELKKKIKDCRVFYNNSAESFAIEIVKTLEELGKKVFDSSKKNYYDEDKWMFFLKCLEHKIPTLQTILLPQNIATAKKELREFNQWPVILKRIDGNNGEYVEKADNFREVEKIINKFWKRGSERLPIIAQEFVDSPSYRVTVVGNKIVQTALKESKGWKKTGNHSVHIKKFETDKELEKIIQKISKVFGINICGIDLLKKDDKWLVLEINSSPGLDFFEKERKKLIEEILDFLKKQI